MEQCAYFLFFSHLLFASAYTYRLFLIPFTSSSKSRIPLSIKFSIFDSLIQSFTGGGGLLAQVPWNDDKFIENNTIRLDL
jgi:hypothetical protein